MKADAEQSILRKVYDFIDILRDANIFISTDEILTVFAALKETTVGNKQIFKQTLKTTLIKDYTDIPAFEKCFQQFFYSQTAVNELTEDENRSKTSSNDTATNQRSPISEQEMIDLEEMINSFMDSIPDQLLFQKSPEQLLSLFLEDAENSDSGGGIGMMLFQTKRSMMQNQMRRHEDAESSTPEENELYRTALSLFRKKSEKLRIGKEIKNREDYLLSKYIYQLKPDEIKEMREIVKRFGQKLKNRISLRKKRTKHGGIDVKRTIRTSLQYGGVPFKIHYKDRKIDRPQLVVLCDVSSSVNQYTRFMLLLTHTLQSLFSKVRTFAFIGNCVEITHLFMEMDPERAINSIFNDTEFTYGWGSNYGKSFDQFMSNYSDSLNKKTTILILGDARNNNQDPGLNFFIRMRELSRNIFWLNPEKRHLWDWSDSIASVYRKHCSEMKEVNNFLDLSEFINKLF